MTLRAPIRGLFLFAALLCNAVHAADDAGSCKYRRLAELPLRYTGPGLQITTDGSIDGVPAPMLIDTGADSSYLSGTGVWRRQLPIQMTSARAIGVGGEARLYNVELNEFSIGPIKAGQISMPMIGDTGFTPSYDAIVGASFLLQADLELSLAEKKLRLFSGKGCDDNSFLGYWGQDIFEVPFKRRAGEGANPHFTIEVNGQPMEAVIDTGAKVTSIVARAAKRAGLKLDAPDPTQPGVANGIGKERVARWTTLADMNIGAEKVRNAEIDVLETDALRDIEVILGNDFLRAHRVLFAMSQQKLYISYVGGLPFKHQHGLAPWIVQEAEAGNADAQMALSLIYSEGRGVQKDARQADAWLLKAAANGSQDANQALASARMKQGRYAEAAAYLRTVLDKNPFEPRGALWLYVVRQHAGEAELGKLELEAAFAGSRNAAWPRPIADFFLGRIDEAALLEAAGDYKRLARQRGCEASTFMSALYLSQGERARANEVTKAWRSPCAPPEQANPIPAKSKGDPQ